MGVKLRGAMWKMWRCAGVKMMEFVDYQIFILNKASN
jgi:hypothetical protein